MAQTTIRITGMKEVTNALRNLPVELKKEMAEGGMDFLKAVRKSAKLRAPRFTGTLASSITVEKNGNNDAILSVGAPYGAMMETGEGLPGWFAFKGGYKSKTRGKMFEKKGNKGKSPGKGMHYVTHYKPFISPALEANIAKLQAIISSRTDKAINRSFQ